MEYTRKNYCQGEVFNFGGQTTKCKKCGSELLDDSGYCMDCGSRVDHDTSVGSSYVDLPFGAAIACPKCGTRNSRTDQLCGKCDTDLTDVKRRLALERLGGIGCPMCGMSNPSGSRYCRKCGGAMAVMGISEAAQVVTVRCRYCGTRNGPAVSKCSSCGATL